MNPIEHNLTLAAAMLDEMEAYLKSKSLFWPLESRPPVGTPAYPRLTIGGLCMLMDQLEAQREEMGEPELDRHAALQGEFQSLQKDRAAAIEGKSVREAASRLNLWRAYVQDIEASETGAWQYRTEVRQRVMLARLLDLMRDHADLDDLRKAISSLDRRLRPRFKSGEFVWDTRLTPIYPRTRYWFLYGKLKTGKIKSGGS